MSATLEEIQELIANTGKYELQGENTEGANAYAFRAHHLLLNQPVFLKVLVGSQEEEFLAEPRLLVEATETESADSNVVRVYDAERLGTDYVLVAMEYVDGGSVRTRLCDGPMPLMDAVTAAVGILHGLAQLHRALLVHRDVKPANVLLTTRHGRVWSLIADFGSVARIAHAGASATASRHSALYVPPEGWGAPSRYDVRSDIYQVGIVLFEMVNGPLPYNFDAYFDRIARRELSHSAAPSSDNDSFYRLKVAERALARAAGGKGVISFGEQQPYVPRRLKRIINKAVAPDPERRYQRPSDLIGDLEALQLPNWRPSPGGERYVADRWDDRDWIVERDRTNPQRWQVTRRRKQSAGFRRVATTESVGEAVRLVMNGGS